MGTQGEFLGFGMETEKPYAPFTPEEITNHRKHVINQVKAYLDETGNYHSIDDSLISVYAGAISDIRKFTAIIDHSGELSEGKAGRLETSPYVLLKQKAFDNASKLADKLGILSINRKRLQGTIQDNSNEDPFSEFD